MGKQIKSLVCISSIVIPCKEQLKSSSALLKTIHHETPTNAPPPPAERWWKSTLTRKDHQQSRKPHWGTFQRTWKKKKSTQAGHSSSNLRWLAEWERVRNQKGAGLWCLNHSCMTNMLRCWNQLRGKQRCGEERGQFCAALGDHRRPEDVTSGFHPESWPS